MSRRKKKNETQFGRIVHRKETFATGDVVDIKDLDPCIQCPSYGIVKCTHPSIQSLYVVYVAKFKGDCGYFTCKQMTIIHVSRQEVANWFSHAMWDVSMHTDITFRSFHLKRPDKERDILHDEHAPFLTIFNNPLHTIR